MIDMTRNNGLTLRTNFVLIQFKGNRRELYNNPYEFPFSPGDIAIVEAEKGEDYGYVNHLIKVFHSQHQSPYFSVLRRASADDLKRIEKITEMDGIAYNACQEKIKSHKLHMNLVDSEYRFDCLKLTFYFTAEGRVDFRDLVRDLAATFRTRIELRQIGARDELKRWDSIGVCGQNLCCSTFLKAFEPITTQMAKSQHLILNPSKLSGPCGRLKCCLRYEFDNYEDINGLSEHAVIMENGDNGDDLNKLSD